MILTVCSYNSHGLGVGRLAYIQELVDKYQFVMIQEHWLYNEQMGQLQNEFNDIRYQHTWCFGDGLRRSSFRSTLWGLLYLVA